MDIKLEGVSWNSNYVKTFADKVIFVEAHNNYYPDFEQKLRDKLLGKVFDEAHPKKEVEKKKSSNKKD